jgi:hypothetical protein
MALGTFAGLLLECVSAAAQVPPEPAETPSPDTETRPMPQAGAGFFVRAVHAGEVTGPERGSSLAFVPDMLLKQLRKLTRPGDVDANSQARSEGGRHKSRARDHVDTGAVTIRDARTEGMGSHQDRELVGATGDPGCRSGMTVCRLRNRFSCLTSTQPQAGS